MLVAFALRSQFFRLVFPVESCPDVGAGHPPTGSNTAPLPFTRFSPLSWQSCAPVMSACPFLFDQNPSVKALPAPRQTFPKFKVTPGKTFAEAAVVATQTGEAVGNTSQMPYTVPE